MALGTAFHAAVEAILRDRMENPADGWDSDTFDHYAKVLLDNFEERTYLTEFVPEEGYDLKWAERRGVSALSTWVDDVLPQLYPRLVEHSFEYMLHADAQRVIYMKGTIDLVDAYGVIWDWKTSGSERKGWKDKRGSIQAATYTKAVGVNKFNYCVLHEKGMQIVDLRQDERHWDWLRDIALSMAHLVEANLPVWPRIDTDWWCNTTWCSVFASGMCKGVHFPEGFGQARKG